MFNLNDSIAALRDAETIQTSKLLRPEDRTALLEALVASIPAQFVQPHATIARDAIARLLPEKEQGWKAEGVENKAEVAEGSPEAAERSPEGVAEQAEVVGRVAREQPDVPAPEAHKAPAERPRKGRKR